MPVLAQHVGDGLADLAIVRTEDALPAAPELAEADPAIGDTVTVVGYPLGRALTVTTGQVLSSRTDPLNENLGEVLVTDAPVEPGSSGSAVLDREGRVSSRILGLADRSTLKALISDALAE